MLAASFFVFVDIHHFHDRIQPDRLIVNDRRIVSRTTVVNNFRRETRSFDGTRQTVVINQGPSATVVQRAVGGRLNPVPVTQVVRDTPIPSTVKHSPWRDRVIQEPARTGKEQREVYTQQRERSPNVTPPVTQRSLPETAPVAPRRSSSQPETAPVIPQRPPAQTLPPERPPGPTGSERGYPRGARAAPPSPPAQVTPRREPPPVRETPQRPPVPPSEQERGKGHDRDKDQP